MKHPLIDLALATLVIAASSISLNTHAAGFQFSQVNYPDTQPLDVGIWYPSDTTPPVSPNTRFGMAMAIDAPVSETNGALIVISHGYSGWYAGHAKLATALADAGFIVVAPSHSGNTWSDMSSSTDKWAIDRPGQISRVLDYLLEHKNFKNHVNPEHIGIYGFSAGGFTALSLIGGIPDFERANQVCTSTPEFVCDDGMVSAMLEAGLADLPAKSWGYDPRIKAAAIAAPGFGFAYTRDSLSSVTAAVQLWTAEFDESVPSASNAGWLVEQLPNQPDYRVVENADHFSFLIMPCRDAFKQEDPEEYEIICGDAEGFDRQAFHLEMQAEVKTFFTRQFNL